MSAFAKLSMDVDNELGAEEVTSEVKSDEVVEVDSADSGLKQYRPQRSKSARNIKITGFEERKARISKYHVFIIEVSPSLPGVINVARRFNDFKWLRNRLSLRFPGIFVPPLPPSKILGRYENDFVRERMKDLERFLNRIELISAFSDSVEFSMFLSRPETTMTEGKKEIVEQFSLSDINLINKDLIELFPDLANSKLSENHSSHDVPRLKEFLLKVESCMKTLEQSGNKLFSNLANVANEMNIFSDAFDNLYNAESNYPYKPNIERFDLRNEFNSWKLFQDKQCDIYYTLFLTNLRHEHEDIVAFLELFRYRDSIEIYLNKVKQRVNKWLILENNNNSNNNNDSSTDNNNNYELTPKQIEQKNKDFKDEKDYSLHLEIITKIILHSEMPHIWKHKTNDWRINILKFAQNHSKLTQQMIQSWNNIQTENN